MKNETNLKKKAKQQSSLTFLYIFVNMFVSFDFFLRLDFFFLPKHTGSYIYI